MQTLSQELLKRPRTRSEASRFDGSHKSKQNKQPSFIDTSVTCDIGPSVTPLQNRETHYVNIVLQSMYRFFEQPNIKGNQA